jgi:hypothetical protein
MVCIGRFGFADPFGVLASLERRSPRRSQMTAIVLYKKGKESADRIFSLNYS